MVGCLNGGKRFLARLACIVWGADNHEAAYISTQGSMTVRVFGLICKTRVVINGLVHSINLSKCQQIAIQVP